MYDISPMQTALFRAVVCLLLATTQAHGNFIVTVPYDKLASEADLVVLIEPLSSKAGDDPWPGRYPDDFQAYNTLFKVHATLKGGEVQYLTVTHYLVKELRGDPAYLIKFVGEDTLKRGDDPSQWGVEPGYSYSGQYPVWLAFLKKLPDGRYVPLPNYSQAVSFRRLEFFISNFEDGSLKRPPPSPFWKLSHLVRATAFALQIAGCLWLLWAVRVISIRDVAPSCDGETLLAEADVVRHVNRTHCLMATGVILIGAVMLYLGG
jgi:hypothetical protein